MTRRLQLRKERIKGKERRKLQVESPAVFNLQRKKGRSNNNSNN
jgi:hypothetical protein